MLQFFAKLFGGQRQKPPARQRPQVRLSIEELDGRVLPNASALSAATGHCLGHAAHAASSSDTTNSASTSTSATTHGACSGHTSSAGATLTANLSNASGATGTANFNANTTGLKLSVSGATANSSLDVAVDGTSVGTLTTDASGNGKLQLASTDAAIQAGSTISVGDLAGTFTPTKLTASLTGDAGATGTAQFNVRRNDLGVSVSGAAASTTYNITIDNAVVGQFTTNSAGQASQAKTHLSLTDVTVQAGSILTISDTAGNPAIVQGVFA